LFAATQKRASQPRQTDASSSDSAAKATAPSSASRADEGEVIVVKRIMAARNYYEMLGVTRGCSENDLKKAYRKTSLKVHPDKNKAAGAVDAFQRVAEAFDVLSDERKKEIYDQVGHEQYSVLGFFFV
jgi:DnaJ family protein B protein 12